MSKMSELSYDLQQAAMIIADHNYDLRMENEALRKEIKELRTVLEKIAMKAVEKARRDTLGNCGND
jgi:regulator of replication initiation timing